MTTEQLSRHEAEQIYEGFAGQAGRRRSRRRAVRVVGIAMSAAAVIGVLAWVGLNLRQLDDAKQDEHVPAASPGAVTLAAGEGFTCAVLDGGALACWGGPEFGGLGDGTERAHLEPTSCPG